MRASDLAKQTQQLTGFVQEVPKFDVSLEHNHFELKAEHIERQNKRLKPKPILKAKEQLINLKADANNFRLQAAARDISLQAQTAKTGRVLQGKADRTGAHLQGNVDKNGVPLQAQTDKNNLPLKAKVDKNGTPLQAHAIENPRTPLDTLEHGVRPPFHFDLNDLTSTFAPDIATKMDSEIAQARTRTADEVRRRERELEPKLRNRAPQPDMPPIPNKVQVNVQLVKTINEKLAQSKSSSAQKIALKVPVPKLPMDKMPLDRLPLGPMNGSGSKLPLTPTALKIPSPAAQNLDNTNRNKSVSAMEAELANVRQQHPQNSNLAAMLDDAKNRARTRATAIEPGVDAILTHARSIPVSVSPAIPNTNIRGDAQDVVPWDEWHSRFASLARGPILANVSKAKTTSGADTVEITVWRDHRLQVKLSKPSNAGFDAAILSAYKSLAGNTNLEFPKNSVRQSITFLVDNEHNGAGVPSAVQSQPSLGDKEIIRRRL